MTVSNEFPVIDGVAPSFADVSFKITPQGAPLIDMADVKAINMGRSVEVGEKVGASGGRVMKTTTGTAKYAFTMTLYTEGYEKLLANLEAVAKSFTRRGNEVAISLVHFNAEVIWTPPGGIKVHRRCKGLRIIGDTNNPTEGNDPDENEVTCHAKTIANVLANGKEVVML